MTIAHYVTLFDQNYASRALALYKSLERSSDHFVLWVVALDSYVEELLSALRIENLKIIPLREVETPQLRLCKLSRSQAEFCWTLTPFVFDWVFERESRTEFVTYVDADLWFLRAPKVLFDQFTNSEADVLITEHAYHPAFDSTATSGYFCVQFLSVKRKSSSDVISRWKSQCLDWCFAYPEDGKFGDQGYLSEWPDRYPGRVFIPPRKEWFQGPWNALRFPYGEALSFHFHSLVYLGAGRYSVGFYPVPKPHKAHLYRAYVKDLDWAEERIMRASPQREPHGRGSYWQLLQAFLYRWRGLIEVFITT